jgi:hypothetical protein
MIFLGFASLSCEKAVNDTPIPTEPDVTQFKSSGPIKTVISCSGTCDCALEGVLGSDGDDYIQCKCADCVMNIEQTFETGSVQNSVLEDSEIKVEFIREFHDYLEVHHPNQPHALNIITIERNERYGSSYLFEYTVDGQNYSVMYATITGVDGNTKKFEIDCTGSCDCKERYVYADPPYSECSCADCTMTVTQLPTSRE